MDKAAILAEIRELTHLQEIGENDLTMEDLVEAIGVGSSGVRQRMAKLVASGAYETHLVFDPSCNRHRRVWRKAE